MSAMLSKGLPLSSSLTMDEKAKASEKQGILSILWSHFEKNNTTPSLCRTLSADMSSKKWLAQNGSPSENTILPSHELLNSTDDSSLTSIESEDEEDYLEREDLEEKERLDSWSSIQESKFKKGQEPVKTNELNSWISILSQRGDDSKSLPPYVHPLVRRSASTLSKKSLEICTESLGSESGADGFSSYPPSEVEDADDDKAEENLLERAKQTTGLPTAEYNNYLSSKKTADSRSFPPPLPSLSNDNGASLSMRLSRNNGRLVLEAVSVSSQNNIQAQRCEGRLILNIVNCPSTLHQEVENVEAVEEEKTPVFELDEGSVVFSKKCEDEENEYKEDIDELEEAGEAGDSVKLDSLYSAKNAKFSMEKALTMPCGVMNIHELALMMKRPIGLPKRNLKWGSKFTEVDNYTDAAEEQEEPVSCLQSPQRLPVARRLITPPAKGASSFNAYEYFWRTKPITTSSINTVSRHPLSSFKNYRTNYTTSDNSSSQNDINYVGTPMVKSCNEPTRPLFFWEPDCIATS